MIHRYVGDLLCEPNLYVLIHIRIEVEVGYGETCLSPPVINLLTIPLRCLFGGFFLIFEPRQIQRKKPIYVTGSFNQPSHVRATLTRPLKGLVRSPPWGT